MRNGVCALIVTYLPDIERLAAALHSVRPQVERVVLVANGPLVVPAAHADLFDGLEIIRNGENRGLAAAQNQGLELCSSIPDAEYVLFLDDDSRPDPQMVEKLRAVLEGRNASDIAAVGPAYRDARAGHLSLFLDPSGYRQVRTADGPVEAAFLISSGTLCRLRVLRQLGGMRSSYFIDHVDTEWCLRCRAAGYRLLGVPGAILWHHLGDRVRRVWLLRWRRVSQHSPLRHYYMVRNTFLMARDVRLPWIAKRYFFWSIAQLFVFFCIVGEARGRRLKLMLLGALHGMRGQGGRLVEASGRCEPVPAGPFDPELLVSELARATAP